MNQVVITAHAIERFQERFAGNLSWERARDRLERPVRRSRFAGMCAGRARTYVLGEMRFVIQDGVLVTVCRKTYRVVEPGEDLWYLAA